MNRISRGILMVGGGMLQIPAIETAHRMGLYVVLTDRDENCPSRPHADQFHALSTKDAEAHATLATSLARSGTISGVYTQGCDVEYTVALAAKAAGLAGIPPEAALNCNDKARTRRVLRAAGLDSVRFQTARSEAEAATASAEVGFPCIVKPLNNSASRGITRVYKPEGVGSAFRVAIGQCFLDPCVIIEELLEGVEYSVDTVLFGGKLYAAGISERVFRSDRAYAVQIGSITPAALAKPLERAMYGLMERAADALGVDKGAFKGDLILCGDNVKIIEVTARTSGGFDSQYRKPYSYGIDILKCTIDIAMGNPFDPADLEPKWTKWSMTTSVFPAPGRVVSIRGLDEIQRMPAVRKVFMDLHVGDPVKPYEHCANRVNHIILCADTYDELMNAEMAVHNTLEIVTVP